MPRQRGLLVWSGNSFLRRSLAAINQDDGSVQTDIGMDFDQALHIELELDGDAGYEIRSWNVYNTKDYEIDNSISVWTGET